VGETGRHVRVLEHVFVLLISLFSLWRVSRLQAYPIPLLFRLAYPIPVFTWSLFFWSYGTLHYSDFYFFCLSIFDQPLLRIDFLPACIHLAADRTGGNVFEQGHDVFLCLTCGECSLS
jgi:hypothetical protein